MKTTIPQIFLMILLSFDYGQAQNHDHYLNSIIRSITQRPYLTAEVTYTRESERKDWRYTKILYADNRNVSIRIIHLPETQYTLFFDGMNTTYSFNHRNRIKWVDEGAMAIRAMQSYLLQLSILIAARPTSVVNTNELKDHLKVVPMDHNKVELVTYLPGELEMNTRDKTARLLVDTIRDLPLLLVDTTYFLDSLDINVEKLDTIYSNVNEIDSMMHLIHGWIDSYTMGQTENSEEDQTLLFAFKDLFKELTFVNKAPPESEYYLLEFYYVGCTACHLCIPNIKEIVKHYPAEKLSVIAVNGYDPIDRIERFMNYNDIGYSSAMFPKKKLSALVGHIPYPTFILFDGKGQEIMRAFGCDTEFLENIKSMVGH